MTTGMMTRVHKIWCVILCGVCGASVPAHAAPPLRWGDVFQIRASTQAVHFKASYVDGAGRSHTLEEWRDGDRRVRRQTDQNRVTLYMKTEAGKVKYEVVDHGRKVRYGVSQSNLALLGLIVSPEELVTAIGRPKVEYVVTVSRRKTQKTPAGSCQWYRIDTTKHAAIEEICWSRTWGLPLLVEVPDGAARKTIFSIAEVSGNPPPDAFEVKEQDFLFVDVDRDLVGDD